MFRMYCRNPIHVVKNNFFAEYTRFSGIIVEHLEENYIELFIHTYMFFRVLKIRFTLHKQIIS